ncbi:MAG: hypothetical protein JWL75_320 [Parcubacteria group bacterium]|nr:hypothetical protein [Parcubacteria group bacterium]
MPASVYTDGRADKGLHLLGLTFCAALPALWVQLLIAQGE